MYFGERRLSADSIFSAVVFDLPGDNTWLTLLIGEELAHAFLIATGDPTHVPKLRGHEKATQAVMERWNFDMAEHRRVIASVVSHCKNGVGTRHRGDEPLDF
jgi:hypothetical protein